MDLSNQPAQKRQFYLDIARVAAIIMISLNHAVNRSFADFSSQITSADALPLAPALFKAVIIVLSRIGVPLFLMITGVLILNKPMESPADIKRFYKHNLLSLFITTEIWYVLGYWFFVLFSPDNNVLETEGILGAVFGMFETMLFQNQLSFGSMWYMPMILCLYTTLPFAIIVKDKLSGSKLSPILFLPALILFLNDMVLPAVNLLLYMNGHSIYTSTLREADLFSCYYLYIFAGYFVGKGALSNWKSWWVGGLAVLTFVLSCAYQFYTYSAHYDYSIGYSFPLLPICAAFLFELLRRGAHRFKGMQRPITYLSRITFGIYLIHIVIMETLNSNAFDAFMNYSTWNPAIRMFYLEVVSIIGSVAIIALLSKNKLLRKYLFLIK